MGLLVCYSAMLFQVDKNQYTNLAYKYERSACNCIVHLILISQIAREVLFFLKEEDIHNTKRKNQIATRNFSSFDYTRLSKLTVPLKLRRQIPCDCFKQFVRCNENTVRNSAFRLQSQGSSSGETDSMVTRRVIHARVGTGGPWVLMPRSTESVRAVHLRGEKHQLSDD